MYESEQALYERIMRFSFDTDNELLTFEKRLMLENGWTQDYCTRVIEEYKRFVFLAIAAAHPVAPSDQVDQVWHLHLTYTKSYWDQFCPQVLGKTLHHVPSQGGQQEAEKFRQWYENTLDSYQRCFGQKPPEDIWPEASVRFGESLCFQRINTKRHWIIPKQQLNRLLCNAVFVGVVVLAIISCTQDSLHNQQPEFSWDVEFQSKSPFSIGAVIDSILAIFNNDAGFISIIFIGWLVSVIWHVLYELRCPRCKRAWALEKTGVTEAGGWFSLDREEWKCRICNYRLWKYKSSDSNDGDAGSGCGGCGGD